MLIAIVSPSSENGLPAEEMQARRMRLQGYFSPGTILRQFHISGDNIFDSRFTAGHVESVAQRTVAAIMEAASIGPDVIMVSGGIEPGVAAARDLIKHIPIVGTGQSTYNVAQQLGGQLGYRLGILVYEDSIVEPILAQARSYRLDWMISGIRAIGIPLNELHARRPEVRERVIAVSRELVAEGASMIFPQGLSMVPATLDENELSRETGVCVLNGLRILARTAEMMGSLKPMAAAGEAATGREDFMSVRQKGERSR